jgi:hypothetical protein
VSGWQAVMLGAGIVWLALGLFCLSTHVLNTALSWAYVCIGLACLSSARRGDLA